MSTYSLTERSSDRIGFTACLALVIHAALILGISFSNEDRHVAPPSLEVTLAQYKSNDKVEDADFIAQSDQEGSGDLDEKALLTTRYRADFHDTTAHEVSIAQQTLEKSATPIQQDYLQSRRENGATSYITEQQQSEANTSTFESSRSQQSQDIASLSAKLDRQLQTSAKQPRIRRLTSVSTKAAADASYLNDWRAKIEAIGNKNYPEQATKKGVFGNLRLLVAIKPDGSIKEVKMLQSSGHRILDEAAVRIVHLAAPYAPFPPELRKDTDLLEIIRTWQFQQGVLSSSS